jgi:mannitol repressor
MAEDKPKGPRIRVSKATPEETISYLEERSLGSKAIVMAGHMEGWLQKLLLAVCRPLSKTMSAKIFEGYGPLTHFSAKIDITYIFGLIDKTSYDDLRAIKDIRNKFAHTTEDLFFTSEEVDRECQRLVGWKKGNNNHALFEERCIAAHKIIYARIRREQKRAQRRARIIAR